MNSLVILIIGIFIGLFAQFYIDFFALKCQKKHYKFLSDLYQDTLNKLHYHTTDDILLLSKDIPPNKPNG